MQPCEPPGRPTGTSLTRPAAELFRYEKRLSSEAFGISGTFVVTNTESPVSLSGRAGVQLCRQQLQFYCAVVKLWKIWLHGSIYWPLCASQTSQ